MAYTGELLATHKCDGTKKNCVTIKFVDEPYLYRDDPPRWTISGHKFTFQITHCPFCGELLPKVDIPVIPESGLMYQEPVERNKNGNNAKIKVHVLPEEKMREIGFTDYSKDTWYYCKSVYKKGDISFDVSVKKDDSSDWRIDVLDEDFMQPYDYQSTLREYPRATVPLTVRNEVEKYMKILADAGVISGHEYGEYI